nr:hypothetical protein [Mycobacterium szulgai]
MKRIGRRVAVVVTAALAPMAYTAIATPAISRADCDNGSWWDPVANVCRPSGVTPLDCENGAWWDPVANVCRGPVSGQPLNCDYGSLWNPATNQCVGVLPPPQ